MSLEKKYLKTAFRSSVGYSGWMANTDFLVSILTLTTAIVNFITIFLMSLFLQKFMDGQCFDPNFILYLERKVGGNFSHLACVHHNQTPLTVNFAQERADVALNRAAMLFYAYVTPIIFFIGIVGNSLSLRVFLSKPMRKMSACYYLAALAASDIGVLMTYVLLEWLHLGLPLWPGGYQAPIITINGICHSFLFFSYTFRFLSAWLIVIFTIERYPVSPAPPYGLTMTPATVSIYSQPSTSNV